MKISKKIFRSASVVLLALSVSLSLFACTESVLCEHQPELRSTVPSTCTEEGYEEYVCVKCGEVERRVLEKAQHDTSGEPIARVPATCTEAGYEEYACVKCGEVERRVLEKSLHATNGELIARVPATCTEAGYEEYACASCGEKARVELPMLGHTPGASATISSQQICTVCGEVIQDQLDYTRYYGDELAINYYYGTADGYYKTAVDSRYHGTYDQTLEYRDKNGNSLPLTFAIPIQEFYSHDLLSTAGVSTKDGRTYTTSGGFEVSYTLRTLSKRPEELYAWNNGLDAELSGKEHLAYVIGSYPVSEQSSYYNHIYEIVDFATSYIEISKKTADGYEPLRRICSVEDWKLALQEETLTLSADNASPFLELGTYRILFKYDMLWVTDASSPVYDSDGNYGCPYGWINSQYESFYVNVTDEKGAVLVPHDQDATDTGCSFQLRAEIADKTAKFLPAYSTLEFGAESTFKIGARLDVADGALHREQKQVTGFSLIASVYDEESRTYRPIQSFDLAADPKASELASGAELSVTLPRDEELRGRIWKLDILLKTDGYSENAQYYCLIKW